MDLEPLLQTPETTMRKKDSHQKQINQDEGIREAMFPGRFKSTYKTLIWLKNFCVRKHKL